MHVKSVSISNFRCFDSTEVTFELPTVSRSKEENDNALPNVTLLLGINGSGKSTILKAVTLSVLAPVIQASGYRPYYLIRRGNNGSSPDKAEIIPQLILHGEEIGEKEQYGLPMNFDARHGGACIELRGDYEVIKSTGNDRDENFARMFDDDSSAFFMVAYGATRRVEEADRFSSNQAKSRSLRYQRVAGLFEEYVALRPMGSWLAKLKAGNSDRFEEIETILNLLLPSDVSFTGRFLDTEPLFNSRGIEIPYGALSDGYRDFIGVIGDLLYHMTRCCDPEYKLDQVTGVVMIDDVDLHLHPNWQRTVIESISRSFPNIQFIVSSHSPLVASQLHSQNIRMIESAGGATSVKIYSEQIHGLNADQALTGSYFGLTTTRPPRKVKKLNEIANRAAEGDPNASIDFLRELAGRKD